MTRAGFPHSEISGSKPVSGSPELIAADHVFHRLLVPRHSPCALSSLIINIYFLLSVYRDIHNMQLSKIEINQGL
jgi:hypothetical protein